MIKEGYLQSPEFVKPSSKILFCDLDGTLIDRNYAPTSQSIAKEIDAVQKLGWSPGLSSDTPYQALALWRERFGMTGSIIAERGAVVEWNGLLYYDEETVEAMIQSRSKMEHVLAEQKYVLWQGNPVEFIRTGEKVGIPGNKVVLVNNLRQASVGLFFREVNSNGELVATDGLTQSSYEIVKREYPKFDDLDEDLNFEHGLLILSRKKFDKRYGTQLLMRLAGVSQVGMIGNAYSDYVGSDIAIHYAVGDAADEFKAVADFVASKPLTDGVEEIIRLIAN